MVQWSNNRYWSIAGVLLVLIAALTGLHVLELRAEEPRRAVIAMEMLLQGDPIVLHLNGHPYLNKPPLYTYILALSFSLFGSFEEWAVRLPGVLSYILLAAISARWFALYVGRMAGLLSFLFLMSCWDILFYGLVNAGEIDLFYALITFVQVMAIFHYEQKNKPLLLFIISYFFMALGGLTKGMPSLLFQGLTLLSWLIWRQKWKWLFSGQHLFGLLPSLAILAGYFYIFSLHEPVKPYLYNLIFESFDKSAADSDFFEVFKGLIYFPFHLIKLTLPWSLLLLVFLLKDFRSVLFSNPLITFCIIFCSINLLPYWVSPESRGRYLYMFFPFILLVVAYLWSRFKWPEFKWLVGIVCLTAVLRIAYSLWLMPMQQDGTLKAGLIYRELNQELLEQSDGEHFHLYGRPDTIEWPEWLEYKERNYILTPPIIPYQISYYMTKETGEIMNYDSLQPESKFLLKYAEDSLYAKDQTVLFRFRERLNDKEMELIQIPSFNE